MHWLHCCCCNNGSAILARLASIERKIDRLFSLEVLMSKELDDLEAQVTKNEDVEKSAVVLIQGIAAQLAAAGTDPAKLKALSAGLQSSADALAAAVAANTAPPPTP